MLIICFFFNDTATTEIYPLSLHDALPICESNRRVLEEAGAECWIGDPDVIGTLRYALEGVTILLWLLGTVGRPELHGSRLAMMLEKTIDTTARGVVYETGPPAPPEGAATVEKIAGYNEIPYRIVPVGGDLRGAVDELLAR